MKKSNTVITEITTCNFREIALELKKKSEDLISQRTISSMMKNDDAYSLSTTELYRIIGEIYKVELIKRNLEDLVLLYQNETTSPEDKELLKNLLLFCNIATVLGWVSKFAKWARGWIAREMKYTSKDDLFAEGFRCALNALSLYNPSKEWRTKVRIDNHEFSKEGNANFLILKLDNYLKKIISLEINGEKEDYPVLSDGTCKIDLTNYESDCEFSKLKIVKTGKILEEDKDIELEEDTIYLTLPKLSTKFITFFNNEIKYGLQAFLLRVTWIKHNTLDDDISRKVIWGTEIYRKIAQNGLFVDYFTGKSVESVLEDSEELESFDSQKNQDKYYDDYYDNVARKEKEQIALEKKRKLREEDEASTRWLALYLLTVNKVFSIHPVDDKFELVILKDKRTREDKEKIYCKRFEQYEFTEATEKMIRTAEKKVLKWLERYRMFDVYQETLESDWEESVSIFDTIADVNQNVSDISFEIDKEILINKILADKELGEEQLILKDFLYEPDFEYLSKKYWAEKIQEWRNKAERNIIVRKNYQMKDKNLEYKTFDLIETFVFV